MNNDVQTAETIESLTTPADAASAKPVRLRRHSVGILIVGYGVLVPLVAMAMVVLLTYPASGVENVLKVEITYSVALLSFLGGVRWGISLMSGGTHLRFRPLALIALAMPYAWSILFMSPPVALAALMAGFLLVALVERTGADSPVPDWYRTLLVPFTVMIEIALGLTLLFILNG